MSTDVIFSADVRRTNMFRNNNEGKAFIGVVYDVIRRYIA